MTYMNAEAIRIESDERGFEMHIDTTEDGSFVFNIHAIADELYEGVTKDIGSWVAERESARRQYESGIADDPAEQALLDSIKNARESPTEEAFDTLNEKLLERADYLRKAARENP